MTQITESKFLIDSFKNDSLIWFKHVKKPNSYAIFATNVVKSLYFAKTENK